MTTPKDDNKNNDNTPADFMEEPQPGQAYINPHLDMKLDPRKKHECREIVAEIKRFGVSQRQLMFIIELLAMELESNDMMKAIKNIIRASREEQDEKEGPVAKKGLILPGMGED